ncbi:unannotated protein [freshwater metagenome]|uniref:Unannotated protein n=1 Tax=freshwater metagenome TaxID=449393 RepID=A0A6J6LNY5_9ZZZZ
MYDIIGLVIAHSNLFENDFALLIYVSSVKRGRPDNIGKHVDRELKVHIWNANIETCEFMRGESIHVSTDGLNFLRDLDSGATTRSLET